MEKVSIIIPVIRSESAKKCIDAIVKNSGVSVCDYEIISEIDTHGIGCPKMVERLTTLSKHDLVMFLGDDTLPEKDFLKNAIDAMETLPDEWGVVGLNTQDIRTDMGNPLAHWMAHKKMLDYIPGGNFFSTDYEHCWGDNELKDIADELGRWVWAEKSKILHVHPVNKTASYDDGYQKAYDNGKVERDKKTYYRRKRARMQDKYGVKIGIALPLTDQWVYTQFFFSFVKVITEYMTSLVNKGRSISFDMLMPDFPGPVDIIRNHLVEKGLLIGCTHILMMDTDQIYNEDNLIKKMLAHEKPVLGARVHRRYPPFDPLLMGGEIGKLQPILDSEIKKDGEFNKEVKVAYTGTGCILYNSSIFIDMIPDKWFEFKTGDKGQSIGEDIGFCQKLGKAGIPIYVDCSIDIKHLTLMAADWGTHQLFKKLMK